LLIGASITPIIGNALVLSGEQEVVVLTLLAEPV
jgi:hypothetical protein